MSLAPTLTKLDRRVLMAVPLASSARLAAVYQTVVRGWAAWTPGRPSARETREILFGFAHLGYVTYRHGWWQRTPAGQSMLEEG